MAKYISMLIFGFLVGCGSEASEPLGEQHQAVSNYQVGALQVSHNQPASAFITPSSFPSRVFGGAASQLSRISYGALTANVFYANNGLVHVGTLACNGDADHDMRTVAAAACTTYHNTTGINWGGTQHIWMQYAYTGNDITECSNARGTIKVDANLTSACHGIATNGTITVGFPADGAPDFSSQPPDNGDYTQGFTHELLHGIPKSGALLTFNVSHVGILACAQGNILSILTGACTGTENNGQHVFLTQNSNALWGQNGNRNEPVEYKIMAGWLDSGKVQVVTATTGTLGLVANEAPISTLGVRDIRIPRPLHQFLNGTFYRDVLLEFRNQMWVGGCAPGQGFGPGAPNPPCMTANVPGVYVLLDDTQGVAQQYSHYYFWTWSTDPNDTTYYHLKPLPVGVDFLIEPGVTVKVTSVGAQVAGVRVTLQ